MAETTITKILIINLLFQFKKNPKKNFKTTSHNSRDSRKEVRRHLFGILYQWRWSREFRKLKKNHCYVTLEEILNFVENRGIGSGEGLMFIYFNFP